MCEDISLALCSRSCVHCDVSVYNDSQNVYSLSSSPVPVLLSRRHRMLSDKLSAFAVGTHVAHSKKNMREATAESYVDHQSQSRPICFDEPKIAYAREKYRLPPRQGDAMERVGIPTSPPQPDAQQSPTLSIPLDSAAQSLNPTPQPLDAAPQPLDAAPQHTSPDALSPVSPPTDCMPRSPANMSSSSPTAPARPTAASARRCSGAPAARSDRPPTCRC